MAEMNINAGGVVRTTSAFIDILTANKGTSNQCILRTCFRAFAVGANLLCD